MAQSRKPESTAERQIMNIAEGLGTFLAKLRPNGMRGGASASRLCRR